MKYEDSQMYKDGVLYINLGMALKNPRTTMEELVAICESYGITLRYRITHNEVRKYESSD